MFRLFYRLLHVVFCPMMWRQSAGWIDRKMPGHKGTKKYTAETWRMATVTTWPATTLSQLVSVGLVLLSPTFLRQSGCGTFFGPFFLLSLFQGFSFQ